MTNGKDPAFPVDSYQVAIPKHLMTAELAVAMREIKSKIPGLTKREWLAGLAMQGFNSYPHKYTAEEVARASVKAVDALLAELEKMK